MASGLAILAGCGSRDRGGSPSTGSSTTGSSIEEPTAQPSTTGSSNSGSSSTGPSNTGGPTATLDDLAAGLRGPMFRPAEDGYDRARLLFDPEFDAVAPAAVVRVADSVDVQRCVEFAAEVGMAITARSGGHSYIGSSTVAGGLVVDLRDLSDVVSLSPERASVGAGAALIDVYRGLAAVGRAIPAGTCPTVGIGGMTLGGGVGVTGRAWGLTCDNLAAADVVVADGRLVRASAEENPDLFWALRGGGGGTVGIVTDFEFTTHPAIDVVTFVLRWDPAAASDVLPSWLAWVTAAPDELWSNCVFGHDPDLQLRMVGAWLGDERSLGPRLDELQNLTGTRPTVRTVRRRSFLDAMLFMAGCSQRTVGQCRLDDGSADGQLPRVPFAAKSAYLGGVPNDAGIEAMIESVDRQAAPVGADSAALLFDGNGGAIARVADDATAFAHRGTIASVQYYGSWGVLGPAAEEPTRAWVEAAHDRIAPWTTGGAYVNYLDRDLTDSDRAYYGSNAARLLDIKRTWDPDRLFDVGQIVGHGS